MHRHAPGARETSMIDQEELRTLREGLIGFAPDWAQRILLSFHDCRTRHELGAWRKVVAAEIIDAAMKAHTKKLGGEPLGAVRATCPLCGGGSANAYETGFAVPEGLSRHLLGTQIANQCVVFFAADGMAKEFTDRFGVR